MDGKRGVQVGDVKTECINFGNMVLLSESEWTMNTLSFKEYGNTEPLRNME